METQVYELTPINALGSVVDPVTWETFVAAYRAKTGKQPAPNWTLLEILDWLEANDL